MDLAVGGIALKPDHRSYCEGVFKTGGAEHPQRIKVRLTNMKRPGVIIGIHGLANKPPVDEKTRWWSAAIAEGLDRNQGLAGAKFAFEFVYWADLRYDAPLTADAIVEPYLPHDGIGALPSAEDAPAMTGQDVLATVYRGIDRIEEITGVTLVDDLILEHRFDDLWHYHVEQDFARQVRFRLI